MPNCQPLTAARQLGRRVLVTGASGLLGRQVLRELEANGWDTRGLCSSRCREGLVKCDLTQPGEIQQQIVEFKPDIVIHLAAERRPDVVHKQEAQARSLNCNATSAIAKACQANALWLIYVSTDYVFDGTQPPYAVNMRPNPLSEYGAQKLEGERIVLEVQNSSVLRIPLLYGPVENLKESAVTALYSDLQQGLNKADHGQKRYPTYTCDVAKVMGKMLDVHHAGKPLRGIFHWQGDECLTKYDIVQAISEVMGVDASGVIADLSPPRFPRPEDSCLDCSRLALELNIEPAEFRTPFLEALMASLQQTPACQRRKAQSIASNLSTWPPQSDDSLHLQSVVKRRCIGTDERGGIQPMWTTLYQLSPIEPSVVSSNATELLPFRSYQHSWVTWSRQHSWVTCFSLPSFFRPGRMWQALYALFGGLAD